MDNIQNKINITVQHFHGCPNGPKLIENVKAAIKHFGNNIAYNEQIIDTPELAEKYKFRGSPTLLINGEDFEGMKVPEKISLACRFYPSGLPNPEKIILRINEILIEQGK